jgi:hypothetical protein
VCFEILVLAVGALIVALAVRGISAMKLVAHLSAN